MAGVNIITYGKLPGVPLNIFSSVLSFNSKGDNFSAKKTTILTIACLKSVYLRFCEKMLNLCLC